MAEPPRLLQEVDAAALLQAKGLVRAARFGALAALEPGTGWPIASRVGVASDADGAALVLVSGLSAHTKAMRADPRVSLLVGEPGKGDPLAHPRLTLFARAQFLSRGTALYERTERRYLARHPKASLYAGLGDFTLVRLSPERAALNGGFGKAYEMEGASLLLHGPAVEALAWSEHGAVSHMNSDHADAVALYAGLSGAAGEGAWTLTGLDLEGLDLARGDETRRVLFPEPLADERDLRPTLVRMAQAARGAA